jgi:hypothetical protein
VGAEVPELPGRSSATGRSSARFSADPFQCRRDGEDEDELLRLPQIFGSDRPVWDQDAVFFRQQQVPKKRLMMADRAPAMMMTIRAQLSGQKNAAITTAAAPNRKRQKHNCIDLLLPS